MTDEELIAMARLAQHDDRLSTGALYGNLADRIEQLVKERDYTEGTNDTLIALNQDLTAKLAECEAQLGDVVEALQWIVDHRGECFIPELWDEMASDVLAELEGT